MERLRAHATIALSARNKKKGGGSRKAIPASPHSRRDWRERGESGRKDTPFTKAALSFRSVNKPRGGECWKTSLFGRPDGQILLDIITQISACKQLFIPF